MGRDPRTRFGRPRINQGQGGALKTGFEVASRHGADVVVTMDADGQHPPEQLADVVAPIDEDENSLGRRGGIRAFTWLVNVVARTDITDCINGFRAIRGSRLDELIIESRKKGLRIVEVPVTVRERDAGETKKPGIGYALGLARTILATWTR